MGKTKIKVIAIDVYGTILPSIGTNLKRKGLDLFLNRCREDGLILCTCSDAQTKEVLSDFKKANLNPGYFNRFFKMKRKGKNFTREPKNFVPILKYYNLLPEELLVIGDRYERDIKPALDIGCKTIPVPEYKLANENDFDLNRINFY